jgi:two-component system sensor histidine kinase RegB
MLTIRPMPRFDSPAARRPADPVGLTWLTLVRWTSIAAGAGAVVAARSALHIDLPVAVLASLFGLWVVSNLWLTWVVRRPDASTTLAGLLVLADVVVLTGLLHVAGGILNPVAVFYLVQIVMSALVLGRLWTWLVTAAAAAGYASLFLAPAAEVSAAVAMHREVGLHMRGMWLAFALTAVIVALLVTRLAMAVERRDRALDELREKSARASRAAGLATLAAGAAHELSTPLATIAVTARELERRIAESGSPADLEDDARLIRQETDRCRTVLETMAAESGQPMGETPRAVPMADVVAAVRARLDLQDRDRLDVDVPLDTSVVWPVQVLARALGNIVQNACHASAPEKHVSLVARLVGGNLVRVEVIDRGTGMAPADLARAGEPFFTTKPPGRGTGLGLFVARSSVEELGGRLVVDSRQGRGTTVTIELPVDVLGTAHA